MYWGIIFNFFWSTIVCWIFASIENEVIGLGAIINATGSNEKVKWLESENDSIDLVGTADVSLLYV